MAIGFRTSGMFGRKPMFPQNDVLSNGPYGTPGFGDGFNQRMAEMDQVNSNPNAMPIGVKEMTKKPGFFQQGGFGQYALAALSDFGARLNDRDQSMLGDMMAFQQKNQMLAEKARLDAMQSQQQRMQNREDKQWEWQNKPKEANPYRWKANDGSLMELGPDGQPRQVYKDPNKRLEYRQGPDGRFYPIDTADAPLQPVTDDEWNSASPMGGSGGNVTGGFR